MAVGTHRPKVLHGIQLVLRSLEGERLQVVHVYEVLSCVSIPVFKEEVADGTLKSVVLEACLTRSRVTFIGVDPYLLSRTFGILSRAKVVWIELLVLRLPALRFFSVSPEAFCGLMEFVRRKERAKPRFQRDGFHRQVGPASTEQRVESRPLSSSPWSEHSSGGREAALAADSLEEAVPPVADFLACAPIAVNESRRQFVLA